MCCVLAVIEQVTCAVRINLITRYSLIFTPWKTSTQLLSYLHLTVVRSSLITRFQFDCIIPTQASPQRRGTPCARHQ
jgi:hypothetical protein